MDKREHILRAAQVLFAQFGLKKVTTDDIAREASVSKATIYKHFHNKSEIFDEVVGTESRELLDAIKAAVDAEPTVVGKFKAHLLTRMGKIQEFINFYRVTQETWGDYWPHISQVRKRFLREEKQIVKDVLTLGNQRNELCVNDVNLSSLIMVVALTSVEYTWALEEEGLTLSTYIDKMLDMMIQGIEKR
ncbi:MAG: TetR/AcrR family transcriptional regulator [candidate division Zixibacteria bacterium]|nr:TetR/AcrR family transcriptional regulator [candidate division Zixibacteria bacterium]